MNTIESRVLDNVKEYIGFARKRLGDPELAADAVQESLLKGRKAQINFVIRKLPRLHRARRQLRQRLEEPCQV